MIINPETSPAEPDTQSLLRQLDPSALTRGLNVVTYHAPKGLIATGVAATLGTLAERTDVAHASVLTEIGVHAAMITAHPSSLKPRPDFSAERPVITLPQTRPAELIGLDKKAPERKVVKRHGERVIRHVLGENGTVWAEASRVVDRGQARNLSDEIHAIERASGINEKAAREDVPVGVEVRHLSPSFVLKVPVGRSKAHTTSSKHEATKEVPVPEGSNLTLMAAQNHESLGEIEHDNPRPDYNFVLAGSDVKVRVSPSDSPTLKVVTHARPEKHPHHHVGHDKSTIAKNSTRASIISGLTKAEKVLSRTGTHTGTHRLKQSIEGHLLGHYRKQRNKLDLTDFHPDPAAVKFFHETALPLIKKWIPLYKEAAQAEGVPNNWELLAALHGPETAYGDYYKWNGVSNCNIPGAGPAGLLQETSCQLIPYRNDPELGSAIRSLINPNGSVIPQDKLNRAQNLALMRLAYRHWIKGALGSYYSRLQEGPIKFNPLPGPANLMSHIMDAWNSGDTTEGFNGFNSSHPYNPSASVWPGMATTYYLLKREAQVGHKQAHPRHSSSIKFNPIVQKPSVSIFDQHPRVNIQPSSHTKTKEGRLKRVIQYSWPFQTKTTTQVNRVDEGYDLRYYAGSKIRAIASGFIYKSNPNPNGFGDNYPTEKLDSTIGKSPWKYVYYGHTHVLNQVIGKHVKAGQVIAVTNTYDGQEGSKAPSGWIEEGFANSTMGDPVSKGVGAQTPGYTMRWILNHMAKAPK